MRSGADGIYGTMSDLPLVSVVIPTYLRPELVIRAVRSVQSQTIHDFEIIVIVDGRDQQTRMALESIGESRLSIIVPEAHLGQSNAKNLGVQAARTPWVAFLDDDDEWLPRKLELQLDTAQHSQVAHPIVTCRILARDEFNEFHWPRRLPFPGEALSEYFFCPRSPFTGEGMVINSALLTSRELAASVPFRGWLWADDPDWLLRATRMPQARLEFVPESEPLLIWHVEKNRQRITNEADWRESLNYARANRDLFTARSYAGFVLHVVGGRAAAQRDYRAFGPLLHEAFRSGRPSPVDLLAHLGDFIIPSSAQRRVAGLFARSLREGNRRDQTAVQAR
jgi:glycosyltransferase involved in cell wall biosynthesis